MLGGRQPPFHLAAVPARGFEMAAPLRGVSCPACLEDLEVRRLRGCFGASFVAAQARPRGEAGGALRLGPGFGRGWWSGGYLQAERGPDVEDADAAFRRRRGAVDVFAVGAGDDAARARSAVPPRNSPPSRWCFHSRSRSGTRRSPAAAPSVPSAWRSKIAIPELSSAEA